MLPNVETNKQQRASCRRRVTGDDREKQALSPEFLDLVIITTEKAMIRSNKENLNVEFQVPPKTPLGNNHKGSGNNNVFKTPATNRIPLGGKDKNANNFTIKPTSGKKKPLSGPSSTKKSSNAPAPLQIEEDEPTTIEDLDEEIEFIPEKSKPLDDIPLDHIELDYEQIGEVCQKPPFTAIWNDDLDKPFSTMLDEMSSKKIPVLKEPLSQQQQRKQASIKTQPARKKAPPLGEKKPSSSNTNRDFMAPTKSAQAKQRQTAASSTRSLQQQTKKAPTPAVHVDVPTMDQVEQTLNLGWD